MDRGKEAEEKEWENQSVGTALCVCVCDTENRKCFTYFGLIYLTGRRNNVILL
jgi:hypothetical protein